MSRQFHTWAGSVWPEWHLPLCLAQDKVHARERIWLPVDATQDRPKKNVNNNYCWLDWRYRLNMLPEDSNNFNFIFNSIIFVSTVQHCRKSFQAVSNGDDSKESKLNYNNRISIHGSTYVINEHIIDCTVFGFKYFCLQACTL